MERRVTYNKALGIVLLVCASFILYVSYLVGPSINTVTGVLSLLVAILYLTLPAIIYNDQEIQLKNLFGKTVKKYSFSADLIIIKDRKIFVNGVGMKSSAGILVRSEYDDLLAHIQNRQIGQTSHANTL